MVILYKINISSNTGNSTQAQSRKQKGKKRKNRQRRVVEGVNEWWHPGYLNTKADITFVCKTKNTTQGTYFFMISVVGKSPDSPEHKGAHLHAGP